MTRENLIQAIYDNNCGWNCPSHCPHAMEDDNQREVCMECAEKQLAEYEKVVRDTAIDDFIDMLKNEWTIDSILCAHDKYTLIAIFKRIAEQMKGE